MSIGQKIHYISDPEIAEIFEEDANRRYGLERKYANHPYFSFVSSDSDSDVEEEELCNSFRSSRD